MPPKVDAKLNLAIISNAAEFNKTMDQISSKSATTGKGIERGFGQNLGSLTGILTKVTAGLGVAKLAQMGFNEALKANDSLADAYEVKMTQITTATTSFFTTLTKGDFSNFVTNMEKSIKLAKEYKQEMQFLEDMRVGEKLVGASKAAEIAELKLQARYGETVKQREWATNRLKTVYQEEVDRKKQLYQGDFDAYAKKIAAEHNLDVNYVKNTITQYQAMYGLLGPDKIKDEFAAIDKALAPTQFKKYLTGQQAALANIKVVFDLVGAEEMDKLAQSQVEIETLEKERLDSLREIEKFQKSITKELDKQVSNNSAINANLAQTRFNLISDTGELKNLRPTSLGTTSIPNTIPNPDFSILNKSSDISQSATALSSLNDELTTTQQLLSSSIFSDFGELIGKSFVTIGEGASESSEELVKMAHKVIGAFLAEGLAAAISGAFKSAKNPWLGAALATAASGLFMGIWESTVPKFASGGTMPHSGLALVGEKGAELVELPQGARVHSHQQSLSMLRSSSGGVKQIELIMSGRTAKALIDAETLYQMIG